MQYYSYNLFGLKSYLTIGVYDFIEKNECFWLINAIMSYQIYPEMKNENFQVWRLKRKEGGGNIFTLTCDDGNGNDLQEQEIFSDFQGNQAVIWYIDNVLLLPSEY
jgi:hypothetical protein